MRGEMWVAPKSHLYVVGALSQTALHLGFTHLFVKTRFNNFNDLGALETGAWRKIAA